MKLPNALAAVALALLPLTACRSSSPSEAAGPIAPPPMPERINGVPVSTAPYDQVHITWKQRLDQPYLYVEHIGDYRKIGRALKDLSLKLETAGIVPDGALFCLYYDDPGRVPIEQLRARACIQGESTSAESYGLGSDVLPGVPVIYAVVAGAPGQAAYAYPRMFDYLKVNGWQSAGPILELYLNLDSLTDQRGLLTEVQVPWVVAE